MDTQAILTYIILPSLLAGILVPVVMRWQLRRQRTWRRKLLEDNGRMDLIDELCAASRKEPDSMK